MRVDEYAACDATEIAELVRTGQVSGEEVYAIAREALATVGSTLNAVADGPWEAPLDYSADGPFAGVPFVLKDLGAHLADVPTRMGTRLSGRGIRFPSESFLIRRFREAGLAIGGLTTVPEFGLNVTSEALAYGPTRNPWDVTRSAGGSSGGTGALVAAGAVPVGHANDGGGSIRIPAACNGVVGLKPSRGRVSSGPDNADVVSGFSVEFAHTRTMRDCAGLLDAVAGAMPGDKFAIREPARPWSQEVGANPGRLRVAVHTASWSGSPVDPQVAAAVESVARELEGLGHHVEWATPRFDWDAFIDAAVANFASFCADVVEFIAAETGSRPGAETLEQTTLALYEQGSRMTALELLAATKTVNEITQALGEFYTQWDVLLTPTLTLPAPELGYNDANNADYDGERWIRRLFDLCTFTPLFNFSGTPGISLPLGSTSDGLPIGVQLGAPMCEEATLIRVGSQLEAAMPWRDRRPAVHVSDIAQLQG